MWCGVLVWRKWVWLLVFVLLVALAAFSYTRRAPSVEYVVETAPGRLHRLGAVGNRLVLPDGSAFFIRGCSIADPAFLDWEGRFSEELFDEIRSWGFNTVRIPVHPLFWKRYPDYCERYLDEVVDWCWERGLYVIIDWHTIGNPITGKIEWHRWFEEEPWCGNAYEATAELAEDFWSKVAMRYRDKPNVIYEIYNEPAWISWNKWRPVAESLIDVIREEDPDALVLVAGVDWCYDLSKASADPVKRPNIAYAVHVYPDRPMLFWWFSWGYLADEYPVVVTEWGYWEKPNPSLTKLVYAKPLMSFVEERCAGWVAWVFHPTWTPNMIRDWSYDPTDFGEFVKQRLHKASQ